MKKLSEFAVVAAKKLMNDFKVGVNGLSSAEVEKRQENYGKNLLIEEKRSFLILDFLAQFRNPMVMILTLAALISLIVGEQIDALIILIITLFSTVINLVQERKADRAVQRLKEMLKTDCTVIRDGRQVEINVLEVVPGDILMLNAGDLIPADARVIEAKDCFVNQSALTGESFPVEKTALVESRKGELSLSELNNILLSGTNVVTGVAKAIVVATGKNSEFGKISSQLSKKEPETEFTTGIGKFGAMIMKLTLLIVLMIFLFNILLKRDILESFLFAVAVAVGLTPELLPVILSLNMSAGSQKMANKGVIVKKLVAIPNFGSMDILCTDKTGTLTKDQITVVKYVDLAGKNSEEVFKQAYLNSIYQSGIRNPMDDAVKNFKTLEISDYKKIDEVPFDFLRKRMSVIVQKGKKRLLICKGAPEEVMKVCKFLKVGKEQKPVDKIKMEKANKIYRKLSAEGYRVVAIGSREVPSTKKFVYEVAEEKDLTLEGFVAFLDPAKEDANVVVKALENAGVAMKIITGDNELVTKRICKQLDIPVKGIVLGHEIDGMTDDALKVVVEKNTIFARFSPDEKNRIIHALKSNGHVVGYMGDGINDAPSLKTADVGISVNNAVDIAKESADIILTDKNLQVLLDGILEGRKTFANSMKYIKMGVSSNFGNMFSVLGAVLFLPFLPMLPIQILLNNLLYDVSQLTIPGDEVDRSDLNQPKKWDMNFVKKFMVVFGLMSSLFDFVTFIVLYKVYGLTNGAFQTGWFIQSLATQTLIIHVIRTHKMPFVESKASKGLMFSTFSVVVAGWILPFTPLAKVFGFSALPLPVLVSLIVIVLVYLAAVELVKQKFYKKTGESR